MNWFATRTLLLLAPWASFAIHAQEPPQSPPATQPAQSGTVTLAAEPSATPPVNSTLDGRLMYELLLGEFSVLDGAASRGYAIFLDAARRTGDAELYQHAADIALQARSGDAAMQAIDAWRRAYPKSRQANRYLLQTQLALNRTADTLGPLKREINATPLPERPSAIMAIPPLYANTSEKALATQVVETALRSSVASKNTPVSTAAWITIGRMRLQSDDAEGALKAAQTAQELTPDTDGAAFLALELSATDQREQAIPVLERYLTTASPRPEIRLDYARLLLQDGKFDQARPQLVQVTQAPVEKQATPGTAMPSATAEAWLLLGLLDIEQKHLDDAQTSLKKYLDLSKDEAETDRRALSRRQAYLALSQIAEDQKDYTQAEQWLAQIELPQASDFDQSTPSDLLVSQGRPSPADSSEIAADILGRRANLLAKQGKLDEAMQMIQSMSLPGAPSPEEADRARALLGIQVLRNNGKMEDAYKRLDLLNKDNIKQGKPDPDLLYDQAMFADEIGRDQDVEPLLRQVIQISPDNAHAYNALGYAFAERNERLPEAKELIQKALSLSPDDPFITDSMGWVEYRQGNLPEAISQLQRAYKLRPDAEIATHLGEVLWKSGQQDEARAAWRDAQRLNPELPALRETLQRLGAGEL